MSQQETFNVNLAKMIAPIRHRIGGRLVGLFSFFLWCNIPIDQEGSWEDDDRRLSPDNQMQKSPLPEQHRLSLYLVRARKLEQTCPGT